MKCQLGKLNAPSVVFPEIDTFGAKNMVQAAIRAVLESMIGFYSFIKDYLDVKKIAQLPSDILKLPDTLIKQFVDKFFGKLKIPDIGKLITDSINGIKSQLPAGFVIPAIPSLELPKIFVEALKGMFTGKDPVAAVVGALKPITDVISGAVSSVQSAISWVKDWIKQLAKFILLFLSIPFYIMKLAIQFVTSQFRQLIGANPFSGLISAVQNGLTALVEGLMKTLGMAGAVVAVPVNPIVALIGCLLDAVKSIIGEFPTGLPALAKTVG